MRRRELISFLGGTPVWPLAAALAILFTTPVQSRPGMIKDDTYACTSWGAAHQYTTVIDTEKQSDEQDLPRPPAERNESRRRQG